MRLTPILLDRFENFISPEPMSGCWLWGGSGPHGYGQFGTEPGKTFRAHRLSWMQYRGEIPDDMCVLHRCDVRCCVNPDHLFLGTQQDNMSDKVLKGRQKRGETQWRAKLTTEKVREIRKRYVRGNGQHLANEFGISFQSISKIVLGIAWRQS